jgi:hypothetical protein
MHGWKAIFAGRAQNEFSRFKNASLNPPGLTISIKPILQHPEK